jgi:hypothetical protein
LAKIFHKAKHRSFVTLRVNNKLLVCSVPWVSFPSQVNFFPTTMASSTASFAGMETLQKKPSDLAFGAADQVPNLSNFISAETFSVK